MKFHILLFLFLGALLISTPAIGATYKGRVIDADTKKPVEGAVVVAQWVGEQAGITGGTSRVEDVKETLTDKNGDWSIRGPRRTRSLFLQGIYRCFTFLTGGYYTMPPEFIVFKPGYCSWPKGFGIKDCKEKLGPIGSNRIIEGETVEMPQLLIRNRETLLQNIPFTVADTDKMPIYKKLLDQDIEGT